MARRLVGAFWVHGRVIFSGMQAGSLGADDAAVAFDPNEAAGACASRWTIKAAGEAISAPHKPTEPQTSPPTGIHRAVHGEIRIRQRRLCNLPA